MKNPYKFLLILSLSLVYLVIAAGSIVRMTGSGMGCPDWPKCFGYLIPPTEKSQLEWKPLNSYKKGQIIIVDQTLKVASFDFVSGDYFKNKNWRPYTKHDYAVFNATHTWVEFINRLLGVFAGLSTLALFIISFGKIKKDTLVTFISFLIILGMGFQAWLGKTVVDSNLLPFKITLHMGMAFIIVFLLIILLYRENKPQKKISYNITLKFLVVLGTVLTIFQIGMGTQVRQYVDEQIHDWGLNNPLKWLIEAPIIFYIHRSFSLLVLTTNGLIAFMLYRIKHYPIEFLGILFFIMLEIITGILMYYFDFPFSSQPIHLLVASLLFGAQSYFMIRIFKNDLQNSSYFRR